MTVSITPCSKNNPERGRPGLLGRVLAWLALGLALLCALGPALAAEPEIRYAELVSNDEQYVINADVDFELGQRLEDVLEHGIPLHFVAECIITKGRWYWWDEKIVERRLPFRVTYHALTRQYRLSVGSIAQSFDSITGALAAIKRIRNWGVVDADRLKGGESYNVSLRVRLDKSQLPKPFQVTALGSREWDLETPWLSWTMLAGAAR